jgi:hypothetical protein
VKCEILRLEVQIILTAVIIYFSPSTKKNM